MTELSIVMPCLDEEATLGRCIGKAQAYLERSGIDGEVIVADNGSTDASVRIAGSLGARVVHVEARGYGNALMEGIHAARGKYVIMADADDSYDFTDLDPFVEELRKGADLVMGNRFKGGIEKGAMPFLHRYLGNPVLSFIGRLFFSGNLGDFHCGLRGFNRSRILELRLACPGMEFASEMVVKATLAGYRIQEVPVRLYRDGRNRPPHLNSWQDGWRHLRFLLLFSPRWMFLYPGILATVAGLSLTLTLIQGPFTLAGVVFDIHSLLYACALVILGVQMILFSAMLQLMGLRFGRLPETAGVNRLFRSFTLERGLFAGSIAIAAGLYWSGEALFQWGRVNFSNLDPAVTMRHTIPAVSLIIIGTQTIISSFFISAMELFRDQD